MKKLITILAIMIVLVGAVFATTANSQAAQAANGNAVIVITSVIDEEVPVFQLALAEDEEDVTGDPAEVDVNYDVENAAQATMEDTVAAALANGTDVTVSFVINQIANANLKASYSIAVTAARFELKTYSDGSAAPASGSLNSNQYFALSNTPLAVVSSATKVIGGQNAITYTGTTGNELKVQYTGLAKVPATENEPEELGHFDVVWEGNENAVAGTYKATVQIEVTSV